MKQTGLESIQSNVFVPLFGKGVNVYPWFRHTGEFDAMAHYEQGLRLLRMSLESAAPQFLELGTCTKQELEAARKSLDQEEASDYQLFTIPGGQIFQWWATKPR
jgi:hypothetical protein